MRLVVTRGSHVMVIDMAKSALVGDIPSTPGVHGVALAEQAAVGFELLFARAAQADAAFLALQVGPAAHQARCQMLQLGQFDLDLAFVHLLLRSARRRRFERREVRVELGDGAGFLVLAADELHRAVLPEFARDVSVVERNELLLKKPLTSAKYSFVSGALSSRR